VLGKATDRQVLAGVIGEIEMSGLVWIMSKNIILKNFKLLQNDNETGRIFSQPPLISFKRDKNIRNFLVRSVLNVMINRVLLNARANDATLVLLFTMRTK